MAFNLKITASRILFAALLAFPSSSWAGPKNPILESLNSWEDKKAFHVDVIADSSSEIRKLTSIPGFKDILNGSMWAVGVNLVSSDIPGTELILSYLIKNFGLNPNLRDPVFGQNSHDGDSLLYSALRDGSPEVVKVLLGSGANPYDYVCAGPALLFGLAGKKTNLVKASDLHMQHPESDAYLREAMNKSPQKLFRGRCSSEQFANSDAQHADESLKPYVSQQFSRDSDKPSAGSLSESR